MLLLQGEPIKYHRRFESNIEPNQDINLGDNIKVVRNNERFWVEVVGRARFQSKNHFVVRVNNRLVSNKEFNCGDLLCLHRKKFFEKYLE